MPALAPFKAFRRGLGIDPRREVAAPARCPKCGKPVAPLWTPPTPEIVDASGFQVKGGSGFAIKPGQGFVLSAEGAECCCVSNCCLACTSTPNQYTITFSGVTMANGVCCDSEGVLGTYYSLTALGTYCVTCDGPNTCNWSTTASAPGQIYTGNGNVPCNGPGSSFGYTGMVISYGRTGGGWGLTATGKIGASNGAQFFNGAAAGSADDCNSPPSPLTNSVNHKCSLTGTTMYGGGSATISAGC